MVIDKIEINRNSRVVIIAELSANYNGSIEIAVETIKALKFGGFKLLKQKLVL